MTRRTFMRLAMLCSLMGAVLGDLTSPREAGLRKIYKVVKGKSVRCRMKCLRDGDEFWIENVPGFYRAKGEPHINKDGVWSVVAEQAETITT